MTAMHAPPPLPALELEGPAGQRLLVAARSPYDRVGELADALGLDPRRGLCVDGRPVGRHETLARAGLIRGSRLAPQHRGAASTVDQGGSAGAMVRVVEEAGPAAGVTTTLAPGRHVVGRAATSVIRIADPAVEPHHGLLDVADDGSVRFVQLTGRVPAQVAGEPVAGSIAVRPGATLLVGTSRLRISVEVAGDPLSPPSTAVQTPTPGDPWRRTLRRPPRALPVWAPEPVALPSATTPPPRPNAAGLPAAVCTLAGSVLVALVMRSPMFLILGAAGGLASLCLWLAGRIRGGRDGRRARRMREREIEELRAAIAAQRDARWRHHVAATPTVADAISAASAVGTDVWARRADHPDAFAVTLGWGPVTWSLALDRASGSVDAPLPVEIAAMVEAAERFDDAPVATDLDRGAALAVTGPAARAVVRSLIVQLATWAGPADWRLLVVADEPGDWDWCRWLPHTAADGAAMVVAADDAERIAAVLGRLDTGDDRHVLIATDRPDLLAVRTGALRRYLGASASTAVLVEAPSDDAVPAFCRSALEIGSIGLARWRPATSSPARPGRVHVAGITAATAARVARRLAALHDPEDPAAAELALASAVTLSSLRERDGSGPIDDAIAVAGGWRSAGRDPAPAAAIGVTADGVVEIDLARDGPHALIAGTTGSGKSELLRTLVVSLAARSSPDHLTFVLVDYKGGATFDACAELPHTVGVVTDLDERLAERALLSLDAELRRRERLLRAAGAEDLRAYRAVPCRPPLPRLAVVIDEFAALAAELPGFLSSLVGVAQRGRSLGIHLVLATQRPAGVVDDDIRANTNLRLALRLQHIADARDVVGDPAPAAFPRGTPGRAMLRLGPDETVVFQAARSSGPVPPRRDHRLRVIGGPEAAETGEVSELDVLVGAIRHAAALSDVAPPHRPWLPELPSRIDPASEDGRALGPGDVGIVDDPAEQCRRALRWRPEDGHLALLGGRGSGITTALTSVVAAMARERPPARLHVYVIDAGGDHRVDALALLPHCGAVVRPYDAERLGRLLRRLVAELDTRRRTGGTGDRPHVVLAIDGMPALRGALDGPPGAEQLELLTRIVVEGAGIGISCILTAERPGLMPPSMLAACGERWVFRLDDPVEGTLGGVPTAAVPRTGPGRIVVASSGLEAQLATIDPGHAPAAPPAGGPDPVGSLPVDVDAADLPPGRRRPDGETELVVGVDFLSLSPARLTVPDGEHLLVAGPPRSGRTTALIRLAASWRQAHPDGAIFAIAARHRAPFPGWVEAITVDAAVEAVEGSAPGRPCLVVVDDAERVDDDRSGLAALVADRRAGLLVAAAGRPDTLRTQYGHWTGVIRRGRTGLLMSMCADTDGDVLGELLPRHPPLPPRPGLGWLVSGGQRALVQVGRARAVGGR
jgi:S-DNA-T family DNA segregation ATPase FtsK/SpoIIIE